MIPAQYQEIIDAGTGTHRIVWTSDRVMGYQDGLPIFTSEADAMQEATRLQNAYAEINMRCYVEEVRPC